MVSHNRLHASRLWRPLPVTSTAVFAVTALLVAGCSSSKSSTPSATSGSTGGSATAASSSAPTPASTSASAPAASSASAPVASPTGTPITIGISLSLTGDFSDPGTAAQKGYQTWQSVVNAKGGINGHPVQLKIVDDTSSPDQVTTNYQNLISKDKVNFVFGPFSSLLTVPAGQVANRYGYAFIEPAGGGPAVFAEHLPNLFFVQPAPTISEGKAFADYVLSLPAASIPCRTTTTPWVSCAASRCWQSAIRATPRASRSWPSFSARRSPDQPGSKSSASLTLVPGGTLSGLMKSETQPAFALPMNRSCQPAGVFR